MRKKESCINTDYTDGFKIHVESDGTFVGVRGKDKLKAQSAKELNELIKNLNKEHKTE